MKPSWVIHYTDEDGNDRTLEFEGSFSMYRKDAGFRNETWQPIEGDEELKRKKVGGQVIGYDDHSLTSVIQLGDITLPSYSN